MREAVKYDATIIGGGPAGSTAGLLLARAGWSVVIVEKASFPRRKVCGEFISATSLPLLHDLGVGNAYLALAGPEIHRVGLFARDTILASAMPKPLAREQWGRALGRDRLDPLLIEAAKRAGAKVWQPCTVTAVQRVEGAYICKIAADGGAREISASVVIAAHGSWERSALMMQAKPHAPSDLLAFKGHFMEADLPADLMPLLVFPGGYGGMVHTDGARVTLSCCIRRDELQKCRERYPARRAADAVFEHIQASCCGVRESLKHARRDGAWLSAGPIRPGMRARVADGIFKAGNAAGEAHPIIAEGISMAMQSAWLLARDLIARQDAPRGPAAAATDYPAEWEAMFAARIRAAAVFAHLLMRPNAAGLVLPIVKRFPAILTFGARLSGKVKPIEAAA